MLKLTNATRVWQSASPRSLQPGQQVHLRNALPAVAASTSATGASGSAAGAQRSMGTVIAVDPAPALISLDDGRLIRVVPSGQMGMNGQRLTISDLRPGDEFTFTPHRGATTESPSAMPRQNVSPRSQSFGRATIDADDVEVIVRPQAP